MSTVDKALRILELFSEGQPHLGLSQIARQLQWDKSNVQRYISDLTQRGFLQQDPRSKTYYLGPALTRLSMVRALTHPIARELDKVLTQLVQTVGETAHASEIRGTALRTIALEETKIRGTRVYVDPAEPLPFHASASGIAVLSRLAPDRVDGVLSGALARFTQTTPSSAEEVRGLMAQAQANGYAKMSGSFESDVVGLAAPIIGFAGEAVGAVAVATPSARFSPATEARIAQAARAAATQMSALHGHA